MLDINIIRENPDIVMKDLKKRKDLEKLKLVDAILKKDEDWRKLKGKVDELRKKRNELSQNVNTLMKQGKKKEAQETIKKAKKIGPEIEKQELKLKKLRNELNSYLMDLPNILHESVPLGKDEKDNAEIKKWGKPRKESWLKSHGEIAELLGSDFTRSSKIAGHGFYYLKNDLALLNQSLIRFAIDYMISKGFSYVEPPLMMRKKSYAGVVDMKDFENVMYKIDNEDLYMIATSEHPLIAQFANESLQRKKLPIKETGYSMCFRKEVGTHSVDEKGLFRTHQFNKVEIIVLCQQNESWDWHEKMLKFSEEIFQKLELPYRVVNVCTGDMGSIASKKYDIEAWFPREKKYKEVVSCSNCTDYQARRLNIKYEDPKGGYSFVHTLNNTALATSRALVAILENFQNKDGSVTVPKALRKYLGKKKLEPVK